MQTLRKKASPFKYKNDPSRFMGDGMNFKAKLIGILEVNEARGDRMCQEALSDLKMAIRAAGEHKQRIIINIAIDGLRLKDERSGDSLHHHPVHKISFIAQDTSDTRAFGYIFGSPDIGHRFFGLKTEKAASVVVIAMRDLFQVVFELKKKEIELAKQSINEQQKFRYGSLLPKFPDSIISAAKNFASSKLLINDNDYCRYSPTESHGNDLSRTTSPSSRKEPSNEAIADLLDLELELNNIQQGINQMEKITPCESQPNLFHRTDSTEDPFGDSFTKFYIPPPPPSNRSAHRSHSVLTTKSDISNQDQNKTINKPVHEVNIAKNLICEGVLLPFPNQIDANTTDIFADLDPLRIGKDKPYIDKKYFFNDIKNPPKVPLVTNYQMNQISTVNPIIDTRKKAADVLSHLNDLYKKGPCMSQQDPFSNIDPFSTNTQVDYEKDTFNNVNGKIIEQSRHVKSESEPKSVFIKNLSHLRDQIIAPPPRPPTSTIKFGINKSDENDSPPLPKPNRKIASSRYIDVQNISLSSKDEDEYLTPVHKEDLVLNLEKISELSKKLNIPTSQLSNMTISQLTDLLTKSKPEQKPSQKFELNVIQQQSLTEPVVDRYSALRDIKLDNDDDVEVSSKFEKSKIISSSMSESSPVSVMKSAASTILHEDDEEHAIVDDDDEDITARNTATISPSSFEDAIDEVQLNKETNGDWANFDDIKFNVDNHQQLINSTTTGKHIEEFIVEKNSIGDNSDNKSPVKSYKSDICSRESSLTSCSSDEKTPPPLPPPKSNRLNVLSKGRYHHQVVYQKVPIRSTISSPHYHNRRYHRHSHQHQRRHCTGCDIYVDSNDDDYGDDDVYDDDDDDYLDDEDDDNDEDEDDDEDDIVENYNSRQYEVLSEKKFNKRRLKRHAKKMIDSAPTYIRNKAVDECSCCHSSKIIRPKSGNRTTRSSRNKYHCCDGDHYGTSLQRPSSANELLHSNEDIYRHRHHSSRTINSSLIEPVNKYSQTLTLSSKFRSGGRRSKSRESYSRDVEETEHFLDRNKTNSPQKVIDHGYQPKNEDCFMKPKYGISATETRQPKPKMNFCTKDYYNIKKSKIGFEDDFQPLRMLPGTSMGIGLTESGAGDSGISSITEEIIGFDEESESPFRRLSSQQKQPKQKQEQVEQKQVINDENVERVTPVPEGTMHKSESVNIFKIDNDPFDDDFFKNVECFDAGDQQQQQRVSINCGDDNDNVSDSEWVKKFKTFDD